MFLLRNGVTFGKLEIEPLKQAPHIVDVHSDGKRRMCELSMCTESERGKNSPHVYKDSIRQFPTAYKLVEKFHK